MTAGHQSAYYWNANRETKSRIASDPTLSIWDKSRIIGGMNKIQHDTDSRDGRIPFRSVVRTLLGAGAGAAGAFLGARFLGLPNSAHSAAINAGMGLGGLMSSGMVKLNSASGISERDARNAYRLGFLKRAKERGYFEKEALVLFTPGDVAAPVRGGMQLARGMAGRAGSVISAATSPNKETVEIAELEAEEEILRRRLQELLDRRTSSKVEAVVGKRR